MTTVAVRNASISYNGKRAVNDVSFTLEHGDYMAIVGENGSGKSTLIKGIVGINRLEAGTVSFGNKKTQIGYLPQTTMLRRDFPASVNEVVISGRTAGLGVLPFFTSLDKRIAARYMEDLDITRLAKRPYNSLSGGEQRRVLLARAFCSADDLLVLDEPTAGLDPLIASELYRLLRMFHKETMATIIMVSHDVGAAVENAGKILHMEHGIKFFGNPGEYRDCDLGKTFLGCFHD